MVVVQDTLHLPAFIFQKFDLESKLMSISLLLLFVLDTWFLLYPVSRLFTYICCLPVKGLPIKVKQVVLGNQTVVIVWLCCQGKKDEKSKN